MGSGSDEVGHASGGGGNRGSARRHPVTSGKLLLFLNLHHFVQHRFRLGFVPQGTRGFASRVQKSHTPTIARPRTRPRPCPQAANGHVFCRRTHRSRSTQESRPPAGLASEPSSTSSTTITDSSYIASWYSQGRGSPRPSKSRPQLCFLSMQELIHRATDLQAGSAN